MCAIQIVFTWHSYALCGVLELPGGMWYISPLKLMPWHCYSANHALSPC